jgi:3',5'-cyclic-nucleotide phosphodiesterase
MVRLHVVSDQGDSVDQPLSSDSVTVGRSSDADLQLADRFLSREHARFFQQDSDWWVEDLHSCNGTLLNGDLLKAPKRLVPGDEVRLCRNTITFQEKDTAVTPSSTQSGLSLAQSMFVEATKLDRWRRPSSNLGPQSDHDLIHRADMLHMLNEVHRALGSLMNLDELLELLLERAFDVLAPDEVLIFLRQQKGGYYRAAQRSDAEVDAEHLYSETLLHEVADKGMAALVTDVIHDPVFGPADSILARGVRSLAAAPLLDSEGSLGMIVITSIQRETLFQEDDVELLASLASIAAMRIRNVELTKRAAD